MDAIPGKAAPLAEQLASLGDQLHAIYTHMEGWEAQHGPRPDGAPVGQILAELLVSVLAPLARSRPDEVATTTRILDEIGATIEAELLFVASPDR